MHKLLIVILLLIFNLSFGQEKIDPTESLINKLKAELDEQNVSNFFALKCITYGSNYIFDMDDPNACDPNGVYFTIYAFWNNGKESYIKKFDNCGGFNSIKLPDSKAMDFYNSNYNKLKMQKVGSYKVKPDSIAKGKIYSFTSETDHSPLRYYWFYQSSSEFEKKFDKYHLTTEPDIKNLNYESNNNLAIVKLNAICEKIADSLYAKKSFSRLR